ncbi:MAG: GTPase Era, partial [Atribacterota bacterium]
MTYKAGFVTFWGRPNTGKSTLLNRILGQKISIVTNKPQTTRRMVKGILSRPDGQIVFIDTPGLHQPIDGLSTFMAKQAQEALQGVDALLYLTTPEKGFHDDLFYLDTLQSLPCPVFLVVNKMDLFSAEVIHTVINTLSASFSFQETMV